MEVTLSTLLTELVRDGKISAGEKTIFENYIGTTTLDDLTSLNLHDDILSRIILDCPNLPSLKQGCIYTAVKKYKSEHKQQGIVEQVEHLTTYLSTKYPDFQNECHNRIVCKLSDRLQAISLDYYRKGDYKTHPRQNPLKKSSARSQHLTPKS